MNKVRMEKARALKKWDQRADYDATLRVVDNEIMEATNKQYKNSSSDEGDAELQDTS